jgi:hypothetical protein
MKNSAAAPLLSDVPARMLYHGTNEHSTSVIDPEVYLTPNRNEAAAYARGVHHYGSIVKEPKVYAVHTPAGRSMDITGPLNAHMADDGDPDDMINAAIRHARSAGHKYVEFNHPNSQDSGEHRVVISVNAPDELGFPLSAYETAERARQRRTRREQMDLDE